MSFTIMRNKKRTAIGLDVGTTGTRAVQLFRRGGVYSVMHGSRFERSAPQVVSDSDAETIGDEIRACLSHAEFQGRSTIAALDIPDLEFHTLELPDVAEADREDMAQVEVQRLSSQDGGDIEVRHWPLPATRGSGISAIGVGVRRAIVERKLDACRQGGVGCPSVDTAATALCRFGGLLHRWSAESVWGLLDLGYGQTRLVLCMDNVPVLVRNVGVGGAAWTDRIAEVLQTGAATADVQKREHGIARTSRENRGPRNESTRSELASLLLGALRSALNDLAQEIKRSYEYVLSCYPSGRTGDLVLVGGGAAMRNLPEYLKDSLGIQVRPAATYLEDPACHLRYASGRGHGLEEFSLAIGLAVEE